MPIDAVNRENSPFDGFEDYSFSGWDGEDAVPISENVLNAAKDFVSNLPKNFGYPDAAPGADGSVCLEWLIGERGIFVDFNADGSVLICESINGKTFYSKTITSVSSLFSSDETVFDMICERAPRALSEY